MAEFTPLIEAWIRYPQDDWQACEILLAAGGNRRSVSFHAQQCIEKLFKAELMRLGVDVPKTHDLRALSDLLRQFDDSWRAGSLQLDRLSLAAVDLCYPDPSEPELEMDQEWVVRIASELRSRLLNRLGVKP